MLFYRTCMLLVGLTIKPHPHPSALYGNLWRRVRVGFSFTWAVQ